MVLISDSYEDIPNIVTITKGIVASNLISDAVISFCQLSR